MCVFNILPLFLAVISISHAVVFRRGRCVAALAIIAVGLGYIALQLDWMSTNMSEMIGCVENTRWNVLEAGYFVALLICQRELRNPKCLK